ncbi:hypothetical protein ACT4S5_13185 [Kocuria oceani]|uniref:hypothetical protein n=1 Tax=Kocuria oceani TaxID=988827 RepID=UPI0040354D5E
MDVPGVPAGRHIVAGAAIGAAAGCVLAVFTGSGRSIDLGVLVGVSYTLASAWLSGDLPSPTRDRLEQHVKDDWRTLEPIQQGLLIGMVVGAVIALLVRNLVWIAAFMSWGAAVGWLLGRRRRRQDAAPSPQDEGPAVDEREPTLAAAADRHIGEVLSGIDRTVVAEQLSDEVPGLPAERYGTALDAALSRYDRAHERALARRHEVVARARDLDALGGVFELELFNRRPGQPKIDVRGALGDLHDRAALDDAIARTEALLAHAADLGFGAQDACDDRATLQAAHPGFSLEQLSAALNWGYYNGR